MLVAAQAAAVVRADRSDGPIRCFDTTALGPGFARCFARRSIFCSRWRPSPPSSCWRSISSSGCGEPFVVACRRRTAATSGRIFAVTQLGAGAVVALLLVGYEVLLGNAISATSVDALHFSLHPLVSARLAFAVGLILAQAVVFWSGIVVVVLMTLPWRVPRSGGVALAGFALQALPVLVDLDLSARHRRRALNRAGAADGVRRARVPGAGMGDGRGRVRATATRRRRCGSSPARWCC